MITGIKCIERDHRIRSVCGIETVIGNMWEVIYSCGHKAVTARKNDKTPYQYRNLPKAPKIGDMEKCPICNEVPWEHQERGVYSFEVLEKEIRDMLAAPTMEEKK